MFTSISLITSFIIVSKFLRVAFYLFLVINIAHAEFLNANKYVSCKNCAAVYKKKIILDIYTRK